jgi:VIT1/CCC1 family predicted Fe2+/Mn2+ transporter
VAVGTAPFQWTDSDVREIEANYVDERSSLWMYQSLANADRNPTRAALLRQLASYEERHAALWAGLLTKLGRPLPREKRELDHRLIVAMARLLGVGVVLSLVHRNEVDGVEKYRDQARRWQDPDAIQLFKSILPDEIAHEIETANEAKQVGAKGSSLRSLLLGAIDGFASTVALTTGVAGATRADGTVLIAGTAAVVAGALSMAASEYVSVKAEHEARVAQTRMDSEAIEYAPDTKRDELVRDYVAKGLSPEEANRVVARLEQDPQQFLNALTADRYGTSPEENERPGRQGLLTGVSFALAGTVPVVPYLLFGIPAAIAVSVLATAVALFLAGLFRALSSLHPFLQSGLEMLAIGMGAAAGTFLVGLVLGGNFA